MILSTGMLHFTADPRALSVRAHMQVYGFVQEDLQLLEERFPVVRDKLTLRFALAFLKANLPWESGRLYIAPNACSKTFRTRITRFLNAYNWTCEPAIRFCAANRTPLHPNLRGIVDVFPVRTTQDESGARYTGKYKAAVYKFELWVTLQGIPFHCRGPFAGSAHDSSIVSRDAEQFEHMTWELFLADKAYISKYHLLTEEKRYKSRPPPTEADKLFSGHHRGLRSPVEHAIGRLRRFQILRYTSHAAQFTEMAVKFLVWCEHVVRSSKVPGMAEFANELLASDPHDLCGCKFSAPVSDRKKKREQCQLEKQSGKRRAREDDD